MQLINITVENNRKGESKSSHSMFFSHSLMILNSLVILNSSGCYGTAKRYIKIVRQHNPTPRPAQATCMCVPAVLALHRRRQLDNAAAATQFPSVPLLWQPSLAGTGVLLDGGVAGGSVE